MFELADRLIGIYKTFDMTKSVTINPKTFQLPITVSTAEGEIEKSGKGKSSTMKPAAPLADATNRFA
jgi:hypothetical protein